MGIFLRRIAAEANGEGSYPPAGHRWWYGDASAITAAGQNVTATTAMKFSAIWAAYRAIVEGVAGVPCITYRRLERGKERAPNHPLYNLLRWQPNDWQTSMDWVGGVVGNALFRGNHYSAIVPGPRGFVDRLVPLHPACMKEVESLASGRLRYRYWDPVVGEKVMLQPEVFHVRGLGEGGVTGMGILEYAAENIGLQLARERYQAKLYSKAPLMSGVLEAPVGATIDEEQEKAMAASFAAAHSGEAGWHSVALLQGGVTWKQTGMSAKDAQFVETAEFGIHDVARWFNVPVHLLRSVKDPNHSNIEMFDQEFVTHTLRPWCVRIEQAVQRDLIIAKDTYFVEFLLDALVRANMQARGAFYQQGIQAGWLVRNEAREKENMNPLEGLDAPLQPLNMAEPGQAAQARRLATAAAERVVRKELEALRAAAPKHAGKPAEWSAFVASFYSKHERFVAQTLALDDSAARSYVLNQRATVMAEGLAACEGWMDTVVPTLAAIALEPAQQAA